jgi:hypothetical protein
LLLRQILNLQAPRSSAGPPTWRLQISLAVFGLHILASDKLKLAVVSTI